MSASSIIHDIAPAIADGLESVAANITDPKGKAVVSVIAALFRVADDIAVSDTSETDALKDAVDAVAAGTATPVPTAEDWAALVKAAAIAVR